MHTLIFCHGYHLVFGFSIEGMTLFILHRKSKNVLCNPSDHNREQPKAICSEAWHKWLTEVEHSIGNDPLSRRWKNNPAIATLWHTGTSEGPKKISDNKGQTRLLTISLRKSPYPHCPLWSPSRCHQRSGFTSFLLVPLLALGWQVNCPINIGWCQLVYQLHNNTITQP